MTLYCVTTPSPVSHNNTNFLSLSRFHFLMTDVSIPQTCQETPGPLVLHRASLPTHELISHSGQLFLNVSGVHAIHIATGGFQSLMSCLPVPPNLSYPSVLSLRCYWVWTSKFLPLDCAQKQPVLTVQRAVFPLPLGQCRQNKVLGRKSPNVLSSQGPWCLGNLCIAPVGQMKYQYFYSLSI